MVLEKTPSWREVSVANFRELAILNDVAIRPGNEPGKFEIQMQLPDHQSILGGNYSRIVVEVGSDSWFLPLKWSLNPKKGGGVTTLEIEWQSMAKWSRFESIQLATVSAR